MPIIQIISFLVKAIAVMFLLTLVTTGTAEARCGGPGEQYCRWEYFDCNRGLAKNSGGVCVTCGGNNQPACERARRGDMCQAWHENDNGTCKKRGGQGEQPFQNRSLFGNFDCRPGLNVGSNGRCTTCSGNNQPACERARPGNMCQAWHENDNGTCKKRGGQDEQPFQNRSLFENFDCRPGLNVGSNGKCTACSGNNQPACERARPGEMCQAWHEIDKGICIKRGGEGEEPFQNQLLWGALDHDCRPGYNVGSNGRCTACGGLGQINCERGRGGRCDDGLERVDGVCKPSRAKKVEDRMKEDLVNYLGLLLGALGINADTDSETVGLSAPPSPGSGAVSSTVGAGGLTSAGGAAASKSITPNVHARALIFNSRQMANNPTPAVRASMRGTQATRSAGPAAGCFGDSKFQSISVGAVGELGVTGWFGWGRENGWVFRCVENTSGQSNNRWYGRKLDSTSLGAGASVGVVVGVWTKPISAFEGETVGFALSIGAAMETRQIARGAREAKEILENMKSVSPDLAIALWYEKKGESDIGDFIGVSVTVTAGVGIDAGGAYIEADTN